MEVVAILFFEYIKDWRQGLKHLIHLSKLTAWLTVGKDLSSSKQRR